MSSEADPLWREARKASFENGNIGLWFERFARGWTMSGRRIAFDAASWIRETSRLVAAQNRDPGFAAEVREMAERRERMVRELGGAALVARTSAPLTVGTGREHPAGRGFLWHPVMGVPWLPGSTVRGLVRTWARLRHRRGPENRRAARLFGGPARPGGVLFLDALPLRPVGVRFDVRTSHHPGYHREGEMPGDWMDPEPTPFLSVDRGARFLFSVLPRGSDGDRLCLTAIDWLVEALDWVGAGAMTSAGYGRMRREREVRPPVRKRPAPPEDARLLRKEWRESPWSTDVFVDRAAVFLGRFERPSPAAIELLRGRMEELWPGILRDPGARRGKNRDRYRYKERPRALVARLRDLASPGEPAGEEGADPGGEP